MWKWLAGGLAATCLVSLGAPSVAAGDRTATGRGAFDPFGTGPGFHRLQAVADVSPGDVWAVGFRQQPVHQLIKHYDGAAWDSRTGPDDGELGTLRDVQSFGPSDVWVVGFAVQRSFIGHWDGQRWRQVDSPAPAQFDGLSGISGVAPDDVWAVGAASDGRSFPLTDHWDGESWTQVPAPDPGDGVLVAVHATSTADVWAVGRDANAPLIEHWDGSAWSLVDQPAPLGELADVIGFTPDDVWAVGQVETWVDGFQRITPLLEHWDGTAWSLVDAPHMGPLGTLNGLSGTSSRDIWAVGCTLRAERHGHRTVIEHYDGAQWTRVTSPNPAPYATQCLSAVSASSPTEAWAVGTYGYNDQGFGLTHNLLAHWDGTTWKWDRSPRRL
jgi:hypothetical protein